MNLIFILSAIGLLLSGLALFWITTANMSGSSLPDALDWGTMSTVLWQTKFGTICLVRAALFLLLALFMWPAFQGRSVGKGGCAVIAVALLVSNSFAGHAAAANGPSLPWRIGADAAHLLSTSVWPSGLLFFSLFLRHASPGAETNAVVRRFSDVSLVAVAFLVGTGLLNSCFLVGSFAALFVTPYGHALLVKLSILGFILLAAAWNRFRLLPALFQAEPETAFAPLLRRLRFFVLFELTFSAAIVVVVGLLGVTPPPH